MDFRLLGDVEVQIEDGLVDVGHVRQRCVLVVLLLEANRPVPMGELVERVWGERPPHRARNVLSGYVSRLRQALACADGVTLTRTPGGYVLATDPDTIDVHRFRRLVARGRAADDLAEAMTHLTEALRLWRAEPFALLNTPWLDGMRESLEAERLAAELDRNELALRRGLHKDVLPDIEAQAMRHPLDERLGGQLMLALYRDGRRSEALASFEQIRRRLVEELGADPSPPLRTLHQEILGGDAALTAPTRTQRSPREPASLLVPRLLPALPRSFSGRTSELAELDALPTGRDGAASTAVVFVLCGIGGVGKTTLALRWAHQNADRFPDGQLYVNLRGFDPSGIAVTPGEAIRGFLEALGVHPQRVPSTPEAQGGLFRSLLTGRRILVVLDNARDVAQVRPLLPAAPGCLTLITSRNQLTGLVVAQGALALTVDLLHREEARALLASHLGTERIARDPEAVEEIITLCAGLPLALGIVASRAAGQPALRLATLAEELRGLRGRLDALEVGDKKINVRTVFSWSYQALSDGVARLFRLLGLHPGPEVSTSAAAGLVGCSPRAVSGSLDELTRANLLSQVAPDRFVFHDLLRAYAGELADAVEPAEERNAAKHRMLDYYLYTADVADHLLYPHRDVDGLAQQGPDTVVDDLGDAGQALEWFTRERRALLVVARQAIEDQLDGAAGRLIWTMANFLDRRGYWLEWIDVQEDVLHAAARRGDLLGQAVAHRGLQHAYIQTAQNDEADRHGRRALEMFGALGRRGSQAQVRLGLGITESRRNHLEDALTHFLQAEALYEADGHVAGQANALNNAGFAYVLVGQYERARTLCQQAITLQQEVGDRYAEGVSWDSLGYAQHHLGQHVAAITSYLGALERLREQGDRYSEADTLTRLGDAYLATGDGEAARRRWEQALAIYEEVGHPDLGELRGGLTARMSRTRE